ncbi:MAG: GWxTD domain-containing protein [Bacteroidales bacterium]|nr:GWxTD domain-containing protein [Bacteroidales bacterium]
MSKYIRIVLGLFIVISFIGCLPEKKMPIPRNLEMIYNPTTSSLYPEYSFYNIDDSTSILVGQIASNKLLYNNAAYKNKLTSRVKVIYSLYNLDKKNRLVDSLATNFIFEKDISQEYHSIEIPVRAKLGKDYILEIITRDLNRKNENYTFLKIERSSSTLQDFLLRDSASYNLIVKPELNFVKEFTVEHYKNNYDSLNVFFFKKNNAIPAFPESNDSIQYNYVKSDSSWVCYLDSIKYESYTQEGNYYFTNKSVPKGGFVFSYFGPDFPNVNTVDKMIKPLAYIGFNDTTLCPDSIGRLKLAIDSFWLQRASNVDRARDLIQLFYNRVIMANKYFTSFVEGWQTDRGMIYITYGIPDYVFKSDLEEKWIYSPIDLGTGISFTFKYKKNPFSLNHYELDRKKLKDAAWDSVLQKWELGEIIYYQK